MKLNKKGGEIFIPDSVPVEAAVQRTTHMAIAAHPDDAEIMAFDGIAQCYGRGDRWFMGVVVTDGGGSVRTGPYKDYTDGELVSLRKMEQKKASVTGEYGAVALLGYTSREARDSEDIGIMADLKTLVALAGPEILYIHNPADKHETHVAVAVKAIRAIRQLPRPKRPKRLYGCEVWRSLDWVDDEEKIMFDISAHTDLAASILKAYDSQIAGGKRYDLATEGRWRANATFRDAHAADGASAACCAMDLTPLIADDRLDINEFVQGYIQSFSKDVEARLKRLKG